MNTLVILYAASATEYAFKPYFNSLSAFERSLDWANHIDSVDRIDVFTTSNNKKISKNSLEKSLVLTESVIQDDWTIDTFLHVASERSQGFERVVFAFADSPFYDCQITSDLLNTHSKYNAEYTFADGYPAGLTPEIMYPATFTMLAEMLKDKKDPVARDVLFSSLRTDINAFEIETIISPVDLRQLRLSFTCDTKRNALSCQRLFESLSQNVTAELVCEKAQTLAQVHRTLPSFYSLQITNACNEHYAYSPYASQYKKHYNVSTADSQKNMSVESYTKLLENIADFSDDAVISLSLWGDSLLHPQLVEFIHKTLSYPRFSLLIETDGAALTSELAESIAQLVSTAPKRQTEYSAINWVICIDAADSMLYQRIHGFDGFDKANETVKLLGDLFPGAVYPQFTRTIENESQLETFYRYWKDSLGTVLIQKYDSFAGLLEDKKVADLSPIIRNPCWHIRRDMHILLDGTVPQCKCTFFENAYGNVFEDSLEEIWAKGESLYASHVKADYAELCGKCDEYYTFNF